MAVSGLGEVHRQSHRTPIRDEDDTTETAEDEVLLALLAGEHLEDWVGAGASGARWSCDLAAGERGRVVSSARARRSSTTLLSTAAGRVSSLV